MNREIKFRVWHKYFKYCSFIFQINFENKVVDLSGKYEPIYDVPFNDIIFMQYTGLKDMNGVEIYEGDIVNIKSNFKNKEHIGYIDFNNGKFFLTNLYMTHLDNPNDFYEFLISAKEAKVIGNIYENPELLEGNNQ